MQAQRIVRQVPNMNELFNTEDKRLRVAAYARVSTDQEQQEESFEHQVDYYTRYINNHPDWQFVGIYADPGLSGTRADKRPEFQRMIADCKAGKIDKIICKSTSRFARNTVDTLTTVRELKELGIGVYFESHNMDTMSSGGEILLTVLASIAEQESRTISNNVKWTFEKKRERGEVDFNYTNFLGYTKNADREIVVVPEEADAVRRIYRMFISGYSLGQIKDVLMKDGIKTPTGKLKWNLQTISSILKNEKYMGCALLGKTVKIDVTSKRRIANTGQIKQYFVEKSHPPIIDEETFQLAQTLFKERNNMRSSTTTGNGKYSSKYAFSKMIICEECGIPFRRHSVVGKAGETVRTWCCATRKTQGVNACSQKYVKEKDVENAFQIVLKDLAKDSEIIRQIVKTNIQESLDETNANEIIKLQDEIEKHQREAMKLNKSKRDCLITEEFYKEEIKKISTAIKNLTKEQTILQGKVDSAQLIRERMRCILDAINGFSIDNAFNPELFRALIEKITYKNRFLTFYFRIGITKTYRLK